MQNLVWWKSVRTMLYLIMHMNKSTRVATINNLLFSPKGVVLSIHYDYFIGLSKNQYQQAQDLNSKEGHVGAGNHTPLNHFCPILPHFSFKQLSQDDVSILKMEQSGRICSIIKLKSFWWFLTWQKCMGLCCYFHTFIIHNYNHIFPLLCFTLCVLHVHNSLKCTF